MADFGRVTRQAVEVTYTVAASTFDAYVTRQAVEVFYTVAGPSASQNRARLTFIGAQVLYEVPPEAYITQQDIVVLSKEEPDAGDARVTQQDVVALTKEEPDAGDARITQQDVVAIVDEAPSGGDAQITQQDIVVIVDEIVVNDARITQQDIIAITAEGPSGGDVRITQQDIQAIVDEAPDGGDVRITQQDAIAIVDELAASGDARITQQDVIAIVEENPGGGGAGPDALRITQQLTTTIIKTSPQGGHEMPFLGRRDTDHITLTSAATVIKHQRVTLDSSAEIIVASDVVKGIGHIERDAVATEETTVRCNTAPEMSALADGVIGLGVPVYAAANGRISAAGSIELGISRTASAAVDDILIYLHLL